MISVRTCWLILPRDFCVWWNKKSKPPRRQSETKCRFAFRVCQFYPSRYRNDYEQSEYSVRSAARCNTRNTRNPTVKFALDVTTLYDSSTNAERVHLGVIEKRRDDGYVARKAHARICPRFCIHLCYGIVGHRSSTKAKGEKERKRDVSCLYRKNICARLRWRTQGRKIKLLGIARLTQIPSVQTCI